MRGRDIEARSNGGSVAAERRRGRCRSMVRSPSVKWSPSSSRTPDLNAGRHASRPTATAVPGGRVEHDSMPAPALPAAARVRIASNLIPFDRVHLNGDRRSRHVLTQGSGPGFTRSRRRRKTRSPTGIVNQFRKRPRGTRGVVVFQKVQWDARSRSAPAWCFGRAVFFLHDRRVWLFAYMRAGDLAVIAQQAASRPPQTAPQVLAALRAAAS